ncbi:MAG: O-antigen ligase family protein [Oleiphilaceae bacterium]|nr:O-antigen ligase family protein [Oleiphilaceae bacterium]
MLKSKFIFLPEKYSFHSLCTAAYLFFFYMQASLRWPAFEAIRFHFLFGAFLALISIVKILKKKKFVSKLDAKDPLIVSALQLKKASYWLLAIMCVYTVFSYAPDVSADVFVDRVFKYALVAFFVYVAVETLDDLKVIILGVFLAWLKVASEGFLGWIDGSMMWESQGFQRLHGSSAFVGHPNSFSLFALGCLALSMGFYKSESLVLDKIALGLLAIFSLVIIIFTGSRSGYVALFFVTTVLFFRAGHSKFKIVVLSLFLLLAILPFIPVEYYERFESIFTGQEAEGNSSGTRLIIMDDAVNIFFAYPFGVGVEAFSAVRMDMFGRVQNIHMLYLEILTNLGPFGLIVFMLFAYRLLSLAKLGVKEADKLDSTFLSGLCKFVYIFILFRLVFGLFAMDLYEVHWWLCLGLLLASVKLLTQTQTIDS